MKLDYATLISPYPMSVQQIGHIKSPTLKEIWNPDITYNGYSMYLSLLLMDMPTYCEKFNPQLSEWFNSLSDEEKSQLNMFDMITQSAELQEQYRRMLEFFFVESVVWDENNHAYFAYVDKSDDGKIIPVGIIHKGIWADLCDVILQRCGVSQKDKPQELKFKSKAAERIWKKTHKKESKENKNIELPNIVSAYAAFANGINIINIWDMTVYQVYDQFQRQQLNNYFDISCMSIAAWGDKDNHFDNEQWYKNIHEN